MELKDCPAGKIVKIWTSKGDIRSGHTVSHYTTMQATVFAHVDIYTLLVWKKGETTTNGVGLLGSVAVDDALVKLEMQAHQSGYQTGTWVPSFFDCEEVEQTDVLSSPTPVIVPLYINVTEPISQPFDFDAYNGLKTR